MKEDKGGWEETDSGRLKKTGDSGEVGGFALPEMSDLTL